MTLVLDASPRIRATYMLETTLEIEAAVEVLAGEASTGTFVVIPGEDPAVRDRFGMRLESVTPLQGGVAQPLMGARKAGGESERALVELSLPLELTGLNLTTALASVAGNITELHQVRALKLMDLELPDALALASPRPALSIAGVRELTGVRDRPLRIALTPQHGEQFAEADLLLDREVAADPPSHRLEARLRRAAERATAVTITDSAGAMPRHAERVERAGGVAVQVALERTGLSAVTSLRRRTGLCLVGRPTGLGVHGRCEAAGIAFRAWQKLWRLAGVDVLPVPDWVEGDAAADCLRPLLDAADRAIPLVRDVPSPRLGADYAMLCEAAE